MTHEQELAADGFYDAYMTGDPEISAEIDDRLTKNEHNEKLIFWLRDAARKELSLPYGERGRHVFKAYQRVISDVCEEMAVQGYGQ